MSIVYKINVLEKLKDAGWSTYRIEKEKLLPPATVQRLRKGETISLDSLDRLCAVLGLQPGDIIEHIE